MNTVVDTTPLTIRAILPLSRSIGLACAVLFFIFPGCSISGETRFEVNGLNYCLPSGNSLDMNVIDGNLYAEADGRSITVVNGAITLDNASYGTTIPGDEIRFTRNGGVYVNNQRRNPAK